MSGPVVPDPKSIIRYNAWYAGSGPDYEWFVPRWLSGSDYSGGYVAKSNFESFMEEFDDHDPPFYVQTWGGHRTYGLVLHIPSVPDEAWEMLCGLDEYPSLDDERLSELESAGADEAWQSWGAREWRKIIENACAVSCDAVTDADLREHFEEARERANLYWEAQGDTPEMHVDFDRVWDQSGGWCSDLPSGCPELGEHDEEEEAPPSIRRAPATERTIDEIEQTPAEQLSADEIRRLMRHWGLPEHPLPTYAPGSRPRRPRSKVGLVGLRQRGLREGYDYNPNAAHSYLARAIRHYGVTDDFAKAGYLLPDGSFLDFSDGGSGQVVDHRNVAFVLRSDSPGARAADRGDRTEAMFAFMLASGAIRVHPSALGFHALSRPTMAQIRKMIEVGRDAFDYHGGRATLVLELEAPGRRRDDHFTREYNPWDIHELAEDVRRFFG
jgi:hypothetical protein